MLEKNSAGKGFFYQLKTESNLPNGSKIFLDDVNKIEKFNACYRHSSCWMSVAVGENEADIPEETQFLMTYGAGEYTLYFPLAVDKTRTCLTAENGKLGLICETGDNNIAVENGEKLLYTISGEDPYELVKVGFREIEEETHTFRLKEEKQTPALADRFGYCTYNAFRADISHEKVYNLVQFMKDNNVGLGFVLLDVGWAKMEGPRMSGLNEDFQKFPKGLKGFVEDLKKIGDIQVICWHAFLGYWQGFVAKNLPQYEFLEEKYEIPQHIKDRNEKRTEKQTATVGKGFYNFNLAESLNTIPKNSFYEIYYDFYHYLKDQGVSGSKLDAQTWIEFFGKYYNGRIRAAKLMMTGLEGASATFFQNNHINCSSLSNDLIYRLYSGSIVRSSCDYFPDKDDSHGNHIMVNATVGFWLDQIAICDWDMFQSGNVGGEFHAIFRAISGGPVYCTDSPETLDFTILHKLATKDGKIGRCERNAKITRDCLFVDFKKEKKLFKVFNQNKFGWLITAGNSQIGTVGVQGKVNIADVEGIEGDEFGVYSSKRGWLGVFGKKDSIDCTLDGLEAEIFTIVPLKNGYAVIGMTEKYNCNGFVTGIEYSNSTVKVSVMEDGAVGIYDAASAKFVIKQTENKTAEI